MHTCTSVSIFCLKFPGVDVVLLYHVCISFGWGRIRRVDRISVFF